MWLIIYANGGLIDFLNVTWPQPERKSRKSAEAADFGRDVADSFLNITPWPNAVHLL